MIASALVGLAVTYYYDDPGNAKLNTILERGLQLGGLALVRHALHYVSPAPSLQFSTERGKEESSLKLIRAFWPERVPIGIPYQLELRFWFTPL